MPAEISPGPKSHTRPGALYWLVLFLSGLLQTYALAWAWIGLAILGWDVRIEIFAIDFYNALQAAGTVDIALLAIVIGGATANFILLIARSRWAPVALTATAATHLVLWIRVIANSYYAAAPGHVIIPMEIVVTALAILLLRRGVLR